MIGTELSPEGTLVIDALRSYLQLASGMAEVTAGKARETATALISQGFEAGAKSPEMLSAQVQGIADDLVQQSKTNREIMLGLIRTEIDRNVGRMGFVREEELAAVRGHLQRLEAQVNAGTTIASGVAGIAVSKATGSATKAASTAKNARRAATGTARTAGRTAAGAARTAPSVVAPKPRATDRAAAKVTTPAKKTAKKSTTSKAAAKKAPAKKGVKKSAAKKTSKRSTAKKTVKKAAKKATKKATAK